MKSFKITRVSILVVASLFSISFWLDEIPSINWFIASWDSVYRYEWFSYKSKIVCPSASVYQKCEPIEFKSKDTQILYDKVLLHQWLVYWISEKWYNKLASRSQIHSFQENWMFIIIYTIRFDRASVYSLRNDASYIEFFWEFNASDLEIERVNSDSWWPAYTIRDTNKVFLWSTSKWYFPIDKVKQPLKWSAKLLNYDVMKINQMIYFLKKDIYIPLLESGNYEFSKKEWYDMSRSDQHIDIVPRFSERDQYVLWFNILLNKQTRDIIDQYIANKTINFSNSQKQLLVQRLENLWYSIYQEDTWINFYSMQWKDNTSILKELVISYVLEKIREDI